MARPPLTRSAGPVRATAAPPIAARKISVLRRAASASLVRGPAERLGAAQHGFASRLTPSCSRPPLIRSRRRGFGHVQRVLVSHVDDRGPDLDPAGPRSDRGQQREWGGQLPLEVVHADERPVDPEVLGRLGQLDGLQQRVGGGPGLRPRSRPPVTERQETNPLHGGIKRSRPAGIPRGRRPGRAGPAART
jgi:hypothetical protein